MLMRSNSGSNSNNSNTSINMTPSTPSASSGSSSSISPRSKTLTDFSIKSIIGDPHHHNQEHHRHSSVTHQASTIDNPSTTPSSHFCKILDPSTIAPYSDSESSQGDTNELVGDYDDCQQTSEQETKDSQQLQFKKKHRPKNFQCPACKMAFSNNGQLKSHVRIHTGERPFKCNYVDCNKTFTRNEELTRHKLIHTGIRPHACSTCGKRFGRKDHLKKHVRTHERKAFEPNITNPMTNGVNGLPSVSPDTFVSHPNLLVNAHPPPPPPLPPISLNVVPQVNARDLTSLLNHSPPQVLPSNSLNHHPLTVEEQFADYWNKWYNLIGFCQQQQQQQPPQQPPLT